MKESESRPEGESSLKNLLRFDQACTEFERDWPRLNGPKAVSNQIDKHSLDRNQALEIASIDIERQWNAYSESIQTRFLANENIAENWRDAMALVPKWSDYVVMFAPKCDVTYQLQLAEFAARNRFANVTSAVNYSRLSERDSKPVTSIDVFSETNQVCQFLSSSIVNLGRQSLNEPAPFSKTNSAPEKIIIAPYSDTFISRRQVLITKIAERLFEIYNTSSNRAVAVISEETNLEPSVIESKQSVICLAPILINLGVVTIQIRNSA